MKNCYILHGLHVHDPRKSIGRLAWQISPERDGLSPIILSYGFLSALLAYFINPLLARHLSKRIVPGSIGIGHSNGCTLMWSISKQVQLDGLVLINPALDSGTLFPPSLKWIHIYWSRKDEVTWLSQFVPFSPWGNMGTVGYTGEDSRVSQWELDVQHSDITTKKEMLDTLGPVIISRIKESVALSIPST